MGFLKRFFSLRHKQKSARNDCRAQTDAEPPARQDDGDTRVLDERAAFQAKNGGTEEDTDIAVSRLLRSSSAHYKVVEEADYTKLPPLPNPINIVSSRSTSAVTLTPKRSETVQSRGSYRVTVHKRQQLSATVFPNAYPPLTPRRPGVAHTSTPNLLATYADAGDGAIAASTSTSVLVDPRKIPFTPRDASRLSRLRQDPSVISLIKMYDDHGRLAENAFTTTPAPPQRRRVKARKSRRKSTFNELLGCHGNEDLQWAEQCIAQQGELPSDNNISNASTSSLSSIDTPPLDSPATSTFNDTDLDRDVPTPAPAIARDPSASTVTGLEKDAGFSSLVVELSRTSSAGTFDSDDRRAPYLGPYRANRQQKGKEKESLPENSQTNRSTNNTTSNKVVRKLSHRASQIFDFIGERRERHKSQELLQTSGISIPISADEPSFTDVGEFANANDWGTKYATIPQAKSPSSLAGFTGSLGSRAQPRAKSNHPTRDTRDVDSAHEPSQVTVRHVRTDPLRNNQAAASTSTLPAYPASGTALVGKPTKGSTAALVLLQEQREREKEKKRVEAAQRHNQQMLPTTSTPHPSKVAHFKSGRKVGPISRHDRHGRPMFSEMKNSLVNAQSDRFETASLDLRYDAFAANLDARMEQIQQMETQPSEKENTGRPVTRRRGATIDLGVTRAATTQLSGAPATKYVRFDAPQTPTRSKSLRGPEEGQGSSSELSPETAQLMADLRVRRALAHARTERGRQIANAM